ncbi:hypothetical protein EDM56_09990 [Brevibacillus fluminis]|uniref:DUF3955 domain-containing protein n=1 Tax=Brevibacillus fluminis TaxID=511487 RepID=A0A3M8DN67_9BACL|nr:hypothetical protein EDM56_09990 [Brevibacillus fluminis]
MKDKTLTLFVCLATLGTLYFLGFLMKTDILTIITFHRDGSTFSFVGAFIWVLFSVFVFYFIELYKKRRK